MLTGRGVDEAGTENGVGVGVAPRSNAGLAKNNAPVDVDIQRRKQNAERLKSLTRKMTSKA